MRIVLDMQGAQGASRRRGIGRYSLSLAQAIVRNRGVHEVLIALNGLFPDTIETIRAAFDGLLPQENIHVWQASPGVDPRDPANTWRRRAAELIREAFLGSLQPDVVHVSSLFEGFGDDAVHTIGLSPTPIPTAVTLYDLIPLIQSATYLTPSPTYEAFYREKLEYLKRAHLLLAISESSRQEAIEHLDVAKEKVVNISAAVSGHFTPVETSAAEERTIRRSFALTRPFLMYSGATDERKNHLRLIKAFSLLSSELRNTHQLAIVGHLPDDHRQKFETYIKICGLNPSEVIITGGVSDKEMVRLYNLCKLFVLPSWHEGFGLPALEAMSCGAPAIGANTSSVPEVIGREDALFDPFDARSISSKMAEVLIDERLRADLAQHGLRQAGKFSWDKSAEVAIRAFEHLQSGGMSGVTASEPWPSAWLISKIAQLPEPPAAEHDWLSIAIAIAENQPAATKKQLLVDVSELVHRDAKTGIQRVVRGVLAELLLSHPEGFRVEPVYALQHQPGYRYARKFTRQFLNLPESAEIDDPIAVSCGDVFLGLDLQHHVVLQQAGYYSHLRNIGVTLYFVVYDLLPLLFPEMFPDGSASIHARWLAVLAHSNGVVCISRAVADEMLEWLSVGGPERLRPLKVGWFHLGANVDRSLPTRGLPADAASVLGTLTRRPTFLMVGTIEPRKGQLLALVAFERLWDQGADINLVLVGKQGWKVDLLVEMLRTHTELGRRLFWLEGISDEYLEKVYAASTCLIAASEGEGFGLPLIEGAQHKLPILARDIPVFREVAGEQAFYFANDGEPKTLAHAINQWLSLHREGRHPKSDVMPWLTWKQSTTQLLENVLNDNWYRTWMPDGSLRYYGSDERFGTQVGLRKGLEMVTTGAAGYLIYGPYLTLDAGSYRVLVFGEPGAKDRPETKVDVTINQASQILAEAAITLPVLKNCLVALTVTIAHQCRDLEIRIWVGEGTKLSVSRVEIQPCPESAMEELDSSSAWTRPLQV